MRRTTENTRTPQAQKAPANGHPLILVYNNLYVQRGLRQHRMMYVSLLLYRQYVHTPAVIPVCHPSGALHRANAIVKPQ